MGLILFVNNDNSWRIQPKKLESFLLEKFEVLNFESINNIERPYSHEILIGEKIEILLHRKGDSIHFNGDFQEICRLVVDLRKFIPQSEKLPFFYSSYNNNIEIEASTTFEEIVNAFAH